MHEANVSNVVRIAHPCDCSESTVSSLKKSYKTEGTAAKKPKTGRPRLSFKRVDATLTRLCRKKIFGSSATLATD